MAAALVLTVLAAACGDDTSDERPRVVVTTTILGDMVGAIAGDDAAVEVLIPRGADPHDFELSAQQTATLDGADLVVLNGLGLEEGLEATLESAAGPETTVLAVAELVDPIPFAEAHEEEGHEEEGHEHGDLDPHVWHDPLRMADAAVMVGAALAELDPSGGYAQRAADYAAELRRTHDEIVTVLSGIPAESRLLVTNHESMGYFAALYGFEVVGAVIPGGSTLAEPSSAELAALVAIIQERGVRAIFAETTQPTDLAEAIASEVGDEVLVVELFTESLGEPGTASDTLTGMLLENARRIAAALGG
jgi:zinc/manganese transport system substrate-binding protein